MGHAPLGSLFENPHKTPEPFVTRGMKVVDHRHKSRFYTIPLSHLLGEEGLVYTGTKGVKVLEEKLKKSAKTFVSKELSSIPSNSIDFLLSKDVLCCTLSHRKPAEGIGILKPRRKALKGWQWFRP